MCSALLSHFLAPRYGSSSTSEQPKQTASSGCATRSSALIPFDRPSASGDASFPARIRIQIGEADQDFAGGRRMLAGRSIAVVRHRSGECPHSPDYGRYERNARHPLQQVMNPN